jgi:hypothetical protein
VSELGGSQISTLLETLPGIAQVLRSPVADAIVNLSRAAARLAEFRIADAEELVRYATRRSLLGNDEGERVLAEIRAAEQRRIEKAAERMKAHQQASRGKAAARPKAVKPAKPAKKSPAAKGGASKAAKSRPLAARKAAKPVKKKR